jgi:hypothetical protein
MSSSSDKLDTFLPTTVAGYSVLRYRRIVNDEAAGWLRIIGKAATEVAVMGASLNLPRLDKSHATPTFKWPSTAALLGQVNNIRISVSCA